MSLCTSANLWHTLQQKTTSRAEFQIGGTNIHTCYLPNDFEVRFYAMELFLARAGEFVNVRVIGYNNISMVAFQNLVMENIQVGNVDLN